MFLKERNFLTLTMFFGISSISFSLPLVNDNITEYIILKIWRKDFKLNLFQNEFLLREKKNYFIFYIY